MIKKYFFVLVSLLVFTGGCGYSLGTLVPPHISTVYVETFDNKTYEKNIEIEITKKIKERYNWDGNLKAVNSREEADAILEGEVVDYVRQAARYSQIDDKDIDEYKLVLVVNLKFKDAAKDEVIWSEENFSGEAYYVVSGVTAADQSRVRANSEVGAFNFAVEDLAQNVVDRTIEGW